MSTYAGAPRARTSCRSPTIPLLLRLRRSSNSGIRRRVPDDRLLRSFNEGNERGKEENKRAARPQPARISVESEQMWRNVMRSLSICGAVLASVALAHGPALADAPKCE